MLSIFKTHDIRTIGDNLTPEITDKLLDSIVLYFRQNLKVSTVVIGRDARLLAPVLASKACSRFSEFGFNVIFNPNPVSTCQFYYSCMMNQPCAGLMFTASHNPGKYIGVKIVAQDLVPVSMGSGLEIIKQYFETGKRLSDENKKSGKVINTSYEESYIDYCMKLSGVRENSLKGLNLLFEFLHGSAGSEISHAFEKAGACITMRNENPDGNFPSGDPNPIIEKSIAPARSAMRNGKFDLGFCFDGDGDRMDIMWKNGEQISPGFNISVIMPELLKIFDGKRRDFYVDMKSIPTGVSQICRDGTRAHIIRNGHAFIKRKLHEKINEGYLGCVEESAHYYLNFPYNAEDFSKGFVSTEYTLFFALLTARCCKEKYEQYQIAYNSMCSISREREWALHCEKNPGIMPVILDEVKNRMLQLGAIVVDKMEDGEELEAVLMRFGLPEIIDDKTDYSKPWAQVAQRISGSEDGLCRFEVTASDNDYCNKINAEVRRITDLYVKSGNAEY